MNHERSKIIIVDDIMANLDQGKNLLKAFYEVYPALSAERLFIILEKIIPDLILLDIEMPEMDGYEAIKKLKADERFAQVPVIFLTSLSDMESERLGFDLGGVDYVQKPFSAPLLIKRIENQLTIVHKTRELQQSQMELRNYTDDLERMVCEKTEEILELQKTILATMADLVEFRDRSTGGHIMRTQLYLKALVDGLLEAGIYTEILAEWDIDSLMYSAQLHDVGKIAISDMVLNKPDKLTAEEFETMKTHVSEGTDVIDRIKHETSKDTFLNQALIIAATHHEKWDGSGYPIGISREDIPLEGRLMAIADVYDALISIRPYKDAFSHEDACRIIIEGSGKHFDPALVEVFTRVQDEFCRIATKCTNELLEADW